MKDDAPNKVRDIDFSKEFKHSIAGILILFIISSVFLCIYIELIRINDAKLVIEEINLAVSALIRMDTLERIAWGAVAIFWVVVLALPMHLIHELIHGVVYRIIIKKKPKFGFGAQGIHVKVPDNTPMKSEEYRYALLAPILTITLIGLATLVVIDVRLVLSAIFIISFNASTSLADIYVAMKLPRNSEVTDTGDVVRYVIKNP